jgi:glycosyltransferase involved in cell wall biosynthesis
MAMMRAAPRTISIVVPAYNEEQALAGAVADVEGAIEGFDDYEIVVVDDGSTDATAAVADELAAARPRVRVIHHGVNRGLSAAYRTGLDEARMEYVTFFGADGEILPESIHAIISRTGEASLVVPYHGDPGARGWMRRLLTWVSTEQVNVLFGWRQRYYQGPTVYPTRLARALPREIDGFFFATEMLVHALSAGYGSVEVPLYTRQRAGGVSKAVKLRNVVKAELAILRLWWNLRVRGRRVVPTAAERPGVEATA